jgi:large subunit ribosomal protein L6
VSRIGKQPVPLPSGVDAQVSTDEVRIKGPKGQLEVPVHRLAKVDRQNDALVVSVEDPADRQSRALWGLTRALIANGVRGVTDGFEKRLVVVGVGYRADQKGKNLELQVGHSHSVVFEPLPGVELSVDNPPGGLEGAQATIVVSGIDKERVGRTAANLRAVRPPEPYKGKGIRYADEYVRLKPGKAAVV